jgi:hypothetical protein
LLFQCFFISPFVNCRFQRKPLNVDENSKYSKLPSNQLIALSFPSSPTPLFIFFRLPINELNPTFSFFLPFPRRPTLSRCQVRILNELTLDYYSYFPIFRLFFFQISTSPPRFIHYNVRVNGELNNFKRYFHLLGTA